MYGPFQPMPTLRNVAVVNSGVPGDGRSNSSNDAGHRPMSPKNPKPPGAAGAPRMASCSDLASWRVPSTFASTSWRSTIGVMAAARMATTATTTAISSSVNPAAPRMVRVIARWPSRG